MQRRILHMDLDTFFVSVERLKDPTLIGKPIIVGGEARGVVSTCSYEARKFGVHSAMPSYIARRLCPQAIWLKGDYAAYSYYSKLVTQIIADRVPLMEKASVDEFYIDLSGMDQYFNVPKYASDLRQEIVRKTGLPISMALSTSKTVAKIGTGEAKPCGELFISEGTEKAFLAPLPISKIPGAGGNTSSILTQRKIHTIGQLAELSPEILCNLLGKHGKDLWEKANGICNRQVNPCYDRKSVSKETTFMTDVNDPEQLLAVLSGMTEKLCYQLRQAGMTAACISLKFKYPDFTVHSRQQTIAGENADRLIALVVRELFKQMFKGAKVRLIGLRLSNLSYEKPQLQLFHNWEKEQKKLAAIDAIRNKYGWKAVLNGSSNFNRKG